MSASKQHIRHAGSDERYSRRRVGQLNRLGGETHKQVMYLDTGTKHKIGIKKMWSARKGKRRARRERRRKLKIRYNTTRVRSRTGNLNVATWNVH